MDLPFTASINKPTPPVSPTTNVGNTNTNTNTKETGLLKTLPGNFQAWEVASFEAPSSLEAIKHALLNNNNYPDDDTDTLLVAKFKEALNELQQSPPEDSHSARTLDLRGYPVNEDTLKTLAQIYPQVQSVTLENVLQLKDSHLAQLQHFKRLTHLDISGCLQITDQGLTHLQSLHQLESLNLAGCIYIQDKGLQYLQGLNHLSSLNLAGCIYIYNKGLEHLGNFSQLSSLNLAGCHHITDEGLLDLQNLPQLSSLNLADCFSITDRGLRFLKGLKKNLKVLNLSGCPYIMEGGEGVEALQKFVNLTSLNLTGCRHFTMGNIVSILKKLTHLKELTLAAPRRGEIDGPRLDQLSQQFPEIAFYEASAETQSATKRRRLN